jgi:hypothetical protein
VRRPARDFFLKSDLDDDATTANVRAASWHALFGAETAKRLEHRMHKQRFAKIQAL